MAMARTWLVTNRGIARKIKNPLIKDAGVEAYLECPNCKHLIDNSDVGSDWPGLPAGVKFDPSDVELLEHLAGKIGLKNSKPHLLIDEFIPMLKEDEGICYTHPQNLPGAKKDGSSIHFFHKVSNAYGRGHRKRRKINNWFGDESEECVRWHKTGKTKHVLENGEHKGWKKIMVLYRGGSAPKQGQMKKKKESWVMHQYHIGPQEDEMEGEVVVSKVFYQQQVTLQEQENVVSQVEKKSEMEDCVNVEASEVFAVGIGPRTPLTSESGLLSRMKNKGSPFEAKENNNLPFMLDQEEKYPTAATSENPPWWAGESQAIIVDEPNPGNILVCGEALDAFPHPEDPSNIDCSKNDKNISYEFSDLDSILVDTPPDFQLADLQFGSQESTMSWLDNLEKDEQ